MPILAAVTMAFFQDSSIGATGEQVMLAFTIGINFMCGVYPGGTTMGTLELFHVAYDIYLKFTLKIFLSMLIVARFIISIS